MVHRGQGWSVGVRDGQLDPTHCLGPRTSFKGLNESVEQGESLAAHVLVEKTYFETDTQGQKWFIRQQH